jgi:hypothetical protein
MQQIAEHYAKPMHGELGGSFARVNDFNHQFFLRWGTWRVSDYLYS